MKSTFNSIVVLLSLYSIENDMVVRLTLLSCGLVQRLSDDSQLGNRSVELHVRVPLEKEVPLAPLIEGPKPAEEFPELTEVPFTVF